MKEDGHLRLIGDRFILMRLYFPVERLYLPTRSMQNSSIDSGCSRLSLASSSRYPNLFLRYSKLH